MSVKSRDTGSHTPESRSKKSTLDGKAMTNAVIYHSKDGSIKGFVIGGHAVDRTGFVGFIKGLFTSRKAKPVKKGEYDLVCSAISAISFTALGALDEICGIRNYREEDGRLEMMLPNNLAGDVAGQAGTILRTMEIGLKQVEDQYPEHLRVLYREV